ncbi:DUF3515 domain-containing protein [Dactylosporangium sp. NPDC051485]|uniref:DUF3515 domain-containing protein n=1 Tax=Dactylosporangium sp. NPDC051485 TaxID=3154846 RepID=UPI00343A3764
MTAGTTRPGAGASPGRIATLAALPIALVAGIAAYWALGGFPSHANKPSAAAVPVEAPQLEPSTSTVCRALVAKLPDVLGGLSRRPVTAGGEQNAAFGDPPIVLTCGVPKPAVPADAQFMGLSNVCWFADEQRDRTVWQTVDRAVALRVVVPKAADGSWLVHLSAPIVATVPATDSEPAYC